MVPDASQDLHGYHNWRKGLTPFPAGTIIKWQAPYKGLTLQSDIKVGQRYKIRGTSNRKYLREPKCDADLYYELVLVSPTGKEHSRTMNWSVEGIATFIENGEAIVV